VLNLCGRRSDCTLAVPEAAEAAPPTSMTSLILTRASVSRPSGRWRDDDYDVLENGVVVGRIFCLDAVGPQGRPWMWASGHNGDIHRASFGYEPPREAAMAAFAKSWRRK
jgi:hypothetical protein